MLALSALLLALLCSLCAAASNAATTTAFSASSLTKYNHFVKTPTSDSPVAEKTIHTGGRLIERDLQYAGMAGYSGFLSIVDFPGNDTLFNGVSGAFPSTDYEMQIVRGLGLTAQRVISAMTPESVREVSSAMDALPKPLFVHCHVGYTATLFTQLHLFLTGRLATADEIYARSLSLGFDYRSNAAAVSLINAITARDDAPQAEAIEQDLADGESSYRAYFWTHRLGGVDGFYNVGQILTTHISAIQSAGYHTVVSFRANGEPTVRLPTDPAAPAAVENFEFSDEHGEYSVAEEEKQVRRAKLHFLYLPLVSGDAQTWTKATFDKYAPLLASAASKGAVLTHCASGYRAAAFTLTYLAQREKQCSAWVVQRAQEVGFDLSSDLAVMGFAKDVLGC